MGKKPEGETACIFNIQRFSIHDGPGIRTCVFFKGCPLRCHWCANPESQAAGVSLQRAPELSGRHYTIDEVLFACLADMDFYMESGGGVTLTGGEPLMQGAFAVKLLRALRMKGIHTAMETSGFAPEDVFASAAEAIDLLLFDIKHYACEAHLRGTGKGNQPILRNLEVAVEKGVGILIRIPVIPGYNDSLEDARGFARLIKGFGLTKAQLLPFHQFGQKKYEALGMPYELSRAKPLHAEDLSGFCAALDQAGVECIL